MRDYWLTQYLLSAVAWAYIASVLAALGLAAWLPNQKATKIIASAIVAAMASILPIQGLREMAREHHAQEEFKARHDRAKALFAERCKTAGIKVYRTVEGVEGILLLTARNSDVAANRANPNWEDAALPNERSGDGYVNTFLYWEHNEDRRNPRGYLNAIPSELPGYRFVDLKGRDGKIIHYRLDSSDPDRPKLLKEDISESTARYALAHVNYVDPGDREHWIAGTKVTVTDTRTQQVLAEATWYSFEPGLGETSGFRSPWGFAMTCPVAESASQTRFFIDQVLKPTGGAEHGK